MPLCFDQTSAEINELFKCKNCNNAFPLLRHALAHQQICDYKGLSTVSQVELKELSASILYLIKSKLTPTCRSNMNISFSVFCRQSVVHYLFSLLCVPDSISVSRRTGNSRYTFNRTQLLNPIFIDLLREMSPSQEWSKRLYASRTIVYIDTSQIPITIKVVKKSLENISCSLLIFNFAVNYTSESVHFNSPLNYTLRLTNSLSFSHNNSNPSSS